MHVDVFVMNNYVKGVAEFIAAFVIVYFLSGQCVVVRYLYVVQVT